MTFNESQEESEGENERVNPGRDKRRLPRLILIGATGMSPPPHPGAQGRLCKNLGLLDAEIVSKEKTPWCYFRAEMAFSLPLLNLLEPSPEEIIRAVSVMGLLYHFQLRMRI